MDKNQATGLILFAAVILTYSIFFASGPEIPEAVETSTQTETVQTAPVVSNLSESTANDSTLDASRVEKYGVLATLTQGTEDDITLENELIQVIISNKGGQIKQVTLKEYKSWTMDPLVLFDEKSSKIAFSIESQKGNLVLEELYFQPELTNSQTEDGLKTQILTLKAGTESGQLIQTYSLTEGSFEVVKSFKIDRYAGLFTGKSLQMTWEDQIKAQEKDLAESRRKTEINYYLNSDSYEHLGVGDDAEQENVAEPVKWIAFSQRFFSSGIIADSVFENVTLSQSTPTDSMIVRNMSASLSIPLQNGNAEMRFYFGPDKYKTLKNVTEGFENNVDMGYFFVSWVNKYIIVNLFEFLEDYFFDYGVIIILIVLLIKLVLFPLTYKSYIGMAKMRVIKPEIDELKEKYADDASKMQQEQMKLFSQLGVSPISGCLPLLLQMPFLFAMFFFFPNQSYTW